MYIHIQCQFQQVSKLKGTTTTGFVGEKTMESTQKLVVGDVAAGQMHLWRESGDSP